MSIIKLAKQQHTGNRKIINLITVGVLCKKHDREVNVLTDCVECGDYEGLDILSGLYCTFGCEKGSE